MAAGGSSAATAAGPLSPEAAAKAHAAPETPSGPPPGPETLKFHEPKAKTIGTGFEKKELRRLSPKEKAKRRLIVNSIIYTVGVLILVGVLLLLT